jgi:REase_MTES_1575
VTELPSGEGLTAVQQADLEAFSQLREWTQTLLGLQLCGPDGGESDLLGYRDHPSATLDLTHAHPSGLAMLLAGRRSRLSDLVREPGALADARRRARTVRAVAARLCRLHGVPAGQLAVGMAAWGEDRERRTHAPVLLRAAGLRPRGHGEEDFDLDLAPATRLNPVLVEHLRIEYGVPLDANLLAELAAGHASGLNGFDPLPMLERLAETCADVPGFEVQPRLVVGVFPEVVPALVAELEARGPGLLKHPTLRLLTGPFSDASTTVPVGDAHAATVLDADTDQQIVVDAAVRGGRVAVHAPAGSGATQLLADVVAALVADGQRSLLLSSYADEIADVRRRLDEVGLADLVLDIGADPHDGARVAMDLLGAIVAAHPDDPDGLSDTAGGWPGPGAHGSHGAGHRAEVAEPDDGLTAMTADEAEAVSRRHAALLAGHAEAMHRRHEPWGVSAYAAQVALAELTAMRPAPRSRVRLSAEVLEQLNPHKIAELRGTLREAAGIGAFRVPPSADPWYAARVTSRLEGDLALQHARALADEQLGAARAILDPAFEEVGFPAATTVSDYGAGLRLLDQVRGTLEIFRPEAWDSSVREAVAATASREWRTTRGVQLGSMARRRIQRRTRKLLRPGAPPADLHGALVRLEQQREAWERFIGGGSRPAVPSAYEEARRAYAALTERLDWLAPRLSTTPQGGDLVGTPLDALQERLAALAERGETLAVRPKVVGLMDALQEAGLGPLLEDLAIRTVGPDLVGSELDLVWWASVLARISALEPRYAAHDGQALRAAAEQFADADNAVRRGQAALLRAAVAQRVRAAVAAHPEQVAELRAWAGVSPGEHGGALLARPRVALPVARLLTRCADVVAAISPCWALSPLLTTSVLPPDVHVDVVVIGQAQSVDLARTAPAIARGTSIVVVGDPHRYGGVPQGDSLADIALRRFGQVTLHTAYRPVSARVASLAAAVMAHLDESRATEQLTLPAADGVVERVDAVRLDRVDGVGVLAPGASAIESTDQEVEHVVALVLDHARNRPGSSLAVVALNRLHADRIRDAVRLERGVHPAVAAFFDADAAEPFVVVDATEVAGLVRDVVLVTVGYGRTPHGRMLHQFGLVGESGGAELLLSAVTRARESIVVVCGFGLDDLDPARLKTPGARALRDVLATAAAAGVSQPPTARAEIDLTETRSPASSSGSGSASASSADHRAGLDALLEDFAQRLEAAGFEVRRSVPVGWGVSGATSGMSGTGGSASAVDLPIEMAVRDPDSGRQLAVESDGPAYVAMASVRERDRARAEGLARLGWDHLRIWSTDIFRDPAREVARVQQALRPSTRGRDDLLINRAPGAAATAPAPESSTQTQTPTPTPTPTRSPTQPPTASPSSTPAQTRDDTDIGWGEIPPAPDSHDQWLHEQRPPHWD